MKIKKFLLFTLTFSVILNLMSSFVYADGSISWYIKRNGDKQPKLDKSQQVIYQYGGYYLNNKLNDSSQEKVIYLTFDLGYVNENTLSIIETLNKENIKAAFFILDNVLLKNADLVTDMINHGHLICNHTKNHKDLSNASFDEIKNNLTDLENLCLEKTGKPLAKYFRFPEGRYSISALDSVQKLGYKSIFWSFAYEDWDNGRQPDTKYAIKKVLSNTHNGAIMLFHPTSSTNACIMPELIAQWRSMGYRFGTLDELK